MGITDRIVEINVNNKGLTVRRSLTIKIDRTEEFRITRSMASQLGYYVYLYLDPETGVPLYVGKGKGERILAHLSADGECEKGRAMRRLRESGKSPVLKFVRHGLTENEAFLVESALIDVIGLHNLTNKVSGHGSSSKGIMSFEQLRSKFATEDVVIKDPILMIRMPRVFRYDMTAVELFEATCGTWKIGERRNGVKYVLAVHDEVVQEVYEVDGWQSAGTLQYLTRKFDGHSSKRWEFTGSIVPEGSVRDRYLHKSVQNHFKKGSQNPIRYGFPDGTTDEDLHGDNVEAV